jgi:S-adenosylmethionine:tRNA ribosyltransferase-isomerase
VKVSDFDYDLPAQLIAQEPVEPRDSSRLLVLDRRTGRLDHRRFTDLPRYLVPGDLLVLNRTRVIPARLFGAKEGTGARVEVLLLREAGEGRWDALVRPGRRLRPGHEIAFGDGRLRAVVIDVGDAGTRRLEFRAAAGGASVRELLAELGQVPLPPYVRRGIADPERYQTVYADREGSAAAPTAGLHFTPRLLEELRAAGVRIGLLTLHVGPGTFRPVTAERIEDHLLHREWYEVDRELADQVSAARVAGRRVVAVGTTSVRTLETVAAPGGLITPGVGESGLFIYPGFRFAVIDAMVTNFHLPRSSLVMLVAALAGREAVLGAYREAICHGYRFYSFGDAMLVQ